MARKLHPYVQQPEPQELRSLAIVLSDNPLPRYLRRVEWDANLAQIQSFKRRVFESVTEMTSKRQPVDKHHNFPRSAWV